MILRSILLKNFRSIGDEDGTGIQIPLARINYIIGPNGAGKSNIIAGMEAIALNLADGGYEPKPADYFDRDSTRAMELGATVELSDEERRRLLNAHAAGSVAVSAKDVSEISLFRFVHYTVTFANGLKQAEAISITMHDNTFCTLASARRTGDGDAVELKSLKTIYIDGKAPPKFSSTTCNLFPSTRELVEGADPLLFDIIKRQFSGLQKLGLERKISPAVPAREAQGVSPDGSNLPAELNGLDRDRQVEFDEYMKGITHGDPVGLEPHLQDTEFVLKMKESGLGSHGTHADLGSGQEQSLILGWRMFNASGTILVVREPELHLHAERQKQILQLIRQADPALQFVIETHSPVFLGTAADENVLLITKSEGRTGIAKIAPENMRLIREELGISHADALYNVNVVFVEGLSEYGAFPRFWKTLGHDSAVVPSWFSLGGSGNTMHLRMMLEYLKDDGRRFFVILDGHDDAREHVESLQKAGLLADENCWFLPGSFEDEFDGYQIASAANRMAADAGFELSLDPTEIDVAGRGRGAIGILKKRWGEATSIPFQKHLLGLYLGYLSDDEIPFGIAAALDAAALYFKRSGNMHAVGGGAA